MLKRPLFHVVVETVLVVFFWTVTVALDAAFTVFNRFRKTKD